MAINSDPWWEEPAYRSAMGTFSDRGAFILAKLKAHDAAKLDDVLADLYRDAVPDPEDVTRFEWETILRWRSRTYRSGWAGCGGEPSGAGKGAPSPNHATRAVVCPCHLA